MLDPYEIWKPLRLSCICCLTLGTIAAGFAPALFRLFHLVISMHLAASCIVLTADVPYPRIGSQPIPYAAIAACNMVYCRYYVSAASRLLAKVGSKPYLRCLFSKQIYCLITITFYFNAPLGLYFIFP